MEPEREWQRWTARRKVELLVQVIRGEKTLVDVCQEHDLKQSEVEGWMDLLRAKVGERAGLGARRPKCVARNLGQLAALRARVNDAERPRRRRRNRALGAWPLVAETQ
jgi:transposase-like protein